MGLGLLQRKTAKLLGVADLAFSQLTLERKTCILRAWNSSCLSCSSYRAVQAEAWASLYLCSRVMSPSTGSVCFRLSCHCFSISLPLACFVKGLFVRFGRKKNTEYKTQEKAKIIRNFQKLSHYRRGGICNDSFGNLPVCITFLLSWFILNCSCLICIPDT